MVAVWLAFQAHRDEMRKKGKGSPLLLVKTRAAALNYGYLPVDIDCYLYISHGPDVVAIFKNSRGTLGLKSNFHHRIFWAPFRECNGSAYGENHSHLLRA
jgi:hypothetical protein